MTREQQLEAILRAILNPPEYEFVAFSHSPSFEEEEPTWSYELTLDHTVRLPNEPWVPELLAEFDVVAPNTEEENA